MIAPPGLLDFAFASADNGLLTSIT
jgi:hypothetical protein